MRSAIFLGLSGLCLLAAPALLPRADAIIFFVPDFQVESVGDAEAIFVGRRVVGEFCSGTAGTILQGITINYPGVQKRAVHGTTITDLGVQQGTRIASISRSSTKCTDTDLSVIGTYTGTLR